MRASQGRRLPERTTLRIQRLLAETDLTISEVAESVGHSKAVVLSVNGRFGIRNYIGRSQWLVSGEWELKTVEKAS
jgi:hypothetical protein